MITHLWSSTLILALAIAAARAIPMTARTRAAILTLGLAKFVIPTIGFTIGQHPAALVPLQIIAGPAAAKLPQPALPWATIIWVSVSALLILRWTWLRICITRALLANATPWRGAILQSESCDSPAVVGLFRPRIVLPAHGIDALSDDELAAILAHESAHVRRHDNLRGFLESLIVAAFWFHPLIWFAQRALLRAREEACDELVAATMNAETYAAALARMCRIALAPRVAGISCMAGGFLKERIDHIMSYTETVRRSVSHRVALAFSIVIAAAITLGSGVTMAETTKPELYKLHFKPFELGYNLQVEEVSTGKIVSEPKLVIPKGQKASVDSGFSPAFHIEANPLPDGSVAIFLTVTSGSKTLQKANNVRLPKKAEAPKATTCGPEPITP